MFNVLQLTAATSTCTFLLPPRGSAYSIQLTSIHKLGERLMILYLIFFNNLIVESWSSVFYELSIGWAHINRPKNLRGKQTKKIMKSCGSEGRIGTHKHTHLVRSKRCGV